jgi:hypothetical protein
MSIGSVSNQGAQAYAQQRAQAAQTPISHGHRRHPDASQGVSWTQAQNQAGKTGASGLPSSALEPATATKVGQVLAGSTSSKIVNLMA